MSLLGSFLLAGFGSFFLLSCAGCGEGGIDRETLSGTVTFNGQPVPYGLIYFTPDTSRGNRGPQGFAEILDGKYRTDKIGRGAITGPVIVEIVGYSEKKSGESETPNMPLFPKYRTNAEIDKGTETLDFEVP